ncbi:MFS transporter [Sporolactobacillus sp. STCC-11]|uniref:MFS transporter n=1 Tax=Sporolactobacillus caesalpiniae TaxID=3230362 RepID=UPI0033979732
MNTLMKNKNFTCLFFGRLIANSGDSLYYIAAMWLAYDLGGSVFYSGLAGFLTLLPECLSFLTGPIVDRTNLKKVLVIPSLIQGLLLLLVPLLYWAHLLTVVGVLVIMPLIALIDLFPYPVENALIPRLVGKDQLVAANAAMTFSYQGTDLIFSLCGGLLILLTGAVNLYVINSIAFFLAAVLFSLLSIHTTNTNSQPKTSSYRTDLAAGFRFIFQPLTLNLLLPLLAVNFFLSAVLAVLPAFSKQLGGPAAYGTLLTCYTFGFLLGTLVSSFLAKKVSMGRALIYGYGCSAVMWGFVAWASFHSLIVCCLFLVLATIPFGATNIMFSTFFQMTPPSTMIGRVSAIIDTLIAAAMPLGALFGGMISAWKGNAALFIFQGAVLFMTAMIWLMNKKLRRLPRLEQLKPL